MYDTSVESVRLPTAAAATASSNRPSIISERANQSRS